MAESNATQVILTDDGIKIIKAQNTADNAAGGVANLNDPNLMSVIEKQNNIGQFAGLTSQYNVLVQNAKDDGIDTTAVTAAYNNLNQFMASVLADPDHASDVDRVTYKKYQDAYNEELANLQNALQSNANSKFTSAASATSQAASTANAAKSAADSAYDYASSEMTVQSNATAKAQSTADSAFSQAVTAINTGQATSQAVTDLKDGSTLTIAELGSGIADKISNSEYASYKYQTASQMAELVTDGAFSAYQQTTKDLISSKVANSDFSSYKDETASAIDSKVASSAFATYKDQTAEAISSKVDNGDFSTYKNQTANDINLKVSTKDLIDQINIQAGNTLISSSGQLTLSGKNIYFDSTNPVIIPSANIDTALVNKKLTAADISANTFSTNNETFTVDSNGAITAKNMTLIGGTLTSPTINTSTINGSTINGTTFNAGDIISDSNNTAKYYPMTITPDGAYRSTYFDSAVGLQSSVESGAITYKYRSMIGNGQYSAYDSVINGQGFQSQSGYTSAKDTTFSNPETITGYVNVTTDSGIYLYGPTQKINFAGRSDNIGSNGITMDAYGNIYGQSNSSWWRIGDVNGKQIVNFGIDNAGSNAVQFSRDLWVGNMGLGNGHQIRSKDGHGIYFTDNNSNRVDTYHNNIYYSGSVSKSLLSEKTNVKVADVNCWSNLAMSINLATYNYDTDDYTDPLRLSGIIDDVNTTKEWTLPEAFYARDEDGNIVGIDNGVLLNAVLALSQEQAKQIDKLNTNILAMEAKING